MSSQKPNDFVKIETIVFQVKDVAKEKSLVDLDPSFSQDQDSFIRGAFSEGSGYVLKNVKNLEILKYFTYMMYLNYISRTQSC